jgi:hypothetical protein
MLAVTTGQAVEAIHDRLRFPGRPYGAFFCRREAPLSIIPANACTVSVCPRRLFLGSDFQCCALSVCKPSTDVVSAEGIRSNQRANAKGHVFEARQMRQALLAAMLA